MEFIPVRIFSSYCDRQFNFLQNPSFFDHFKRRSENT